MSDLSRLWRWKPWRSAAWAAVVLCAGTAIASAVTSIRFRSSPQDPVYLLPDLVHGGYRDAIHNDGIETLKGRRVAVDGWVEDLRGGEIGIIAHTASDHVHPQGVIAIRTPVGLRPPRVGDFIYVVGRLVIREGGGAVAWTDPKFSIAAQHIDVNGAGNVPTREDRLFRIAWGFDGTAVLAVLAWGVVLVVRLRREETRRAAGCCRHCGYDRRGSGPTCPECGRSEAAPISHEGDRYLARRAVE